MLLEGKTAVVYGGAGRVGNVLSKAFAREGAQVFLAGRTLDKVRAVAEEIVAAGGRAEAAQVDALDGASVDAHAEAVVAATGRLDVSFNAIGHGDIHGAPLTVMPDEDFIRPVVTALRSVLITARAAARHMAPRRSGVIMAITATTARMSIPNVGGTAVAFDAIESLCRQLARELGPDGIRVVWLRTTGLPETLPADQPMPDYGHGGDGTMQDHLAWLRGMTMLDRLTSLAEVGSAAAFAASDLAGSMTAAGVNLTSGSVPD